MARGPGGRDGGCGLGWPVAWCEPVFVGRQWPHQGRDDVGVFRPRSLQGPGSGQLLRHCRTWCLWDPVPQRVWPCPRVLLWPWEACAHHPIPYLHPDPTPASQVSWGPSLPRDLLRKRRAGADPGRGDRGPSGFISASQAPVFPRWALLLPPLLSSHFPPGPQVSLSPGAFQAGAHAARLPHRCPCLGHTTQKRFTSVPLFSLSKGISCDWKKK